MAFEHLDRAFSKVVMMIVGIYKLIVELFGFDGCNEFLGNFLVKSLESWNDSCLFKLVVAQVVASNEVAGLSAFDGRCQDCIAVVIVQDKNLFVASTGDE